MTDTDPRYTLDPELIDEDSGAVPLIPASVAELLSDVIKNCHEHLVVFDLDSTLLNNHNRSAHIMREYSATVNHSLLATADATHWVDWDARNTMRNIGLTDEDVDTHLNSYERFWEARFFSDEYCRFDTSISGASTFVNSVQSAGGMVVYLTGRSESTRTGTCSSLQAQGFPVSALTCKAQPFSHSAFSADQAALIMRPDSCTSDDLFKREAISRLPNYGRVAAAFDNEPTHINTYRELLPDTTCVHLFTDHSARHVKLHDGIVSIQHFAH